MHTSGYRGATAARSVTRGCGPRERGRRLRFDSAPPSNGRDRPSHSDASWALRRRPRSRDARRAGSRATAPEAVAAGQHVAPQGDEPRGMVAEAARLERECAAIIRGRVRLARADEAAPPARGAEDRSGEAGAPSERL